VARSARGDAGNDAEERKSMAVHLA